MWLWKNFIEKKCIDYMINEIVEAKERRIVINKTKKRKKRVNWASAKEQ